MAKSSKTHEHLSTGPTPFRPVNGYDRPDGANVRIRHPFVVGAVSGTLGAALMTLVGLVLQLAAGSELSFELMLGTLVTGRVDASSWVLGFLWHLVNGALFGLIYAAVFRMLGRSGAALGSSIGVVHWIFGGVLIGILSAINPFIPALLVPSGFFAAGYGVGEALEFLFLHVLFGLVVGAAYRASVIPVSRGADVEDARRAA